MQKQVEYSEAVKTKYPEQVVIVIAKDNSGRANPVTLGWTMFASGNPPMISIAVAKKHYSVETITHSRCFTLCYPSFEMAEAALFYGSKSGRIIDKFAELPCATAPAEKINSVILTDAVANFECTLESQADAGDHIIFIAKVVCSHINTEPKKRLYTTAPGHKLGAVL
jgi:flavin reductase (DIM6/NTAB) family NADH-FMN oxidoreductase RutF